MKLPYPIFRDQGWPWEQSNDKNYVPRDSTLPKISIVTPCYNSSAFIERTIRSVLCQGYQNLEYIIIDGGSTDNTVDIIKYYDKHISYWTSGPDQGQSDALNRGLDLATGDILAWLNADDLYLPDAFHTIAEAYLEDTNRDLLLGLGTIVDKKLHYIHQQTYEHIGPEAFLDWRKNYIIQPGLFFSSRAWKRCRPIREDLEYCMDFDLFYRMSKEFDFHKIKKEIAYSVLHEDCKTVENHTLSIVETAMVEMEHGGHDIAKRELNVIATEHKDLENKVQQLTQANNKSDKLNVLFVISHLEIGGAQTFLIRLLNQLVDKLNIFLLILWEKRIDHNLLSKLDARCHNVTQLNIRTAEGFQNFISEHQIHVINSHLFHADKFVRTATENLSIPIIVSDHGDYKYVDKEGIDSFEECKKILKRANKLIVISEENLDSFDRFGDFVADRCSKIYLGLEPWVPSNSRYVLREVLGIAKQDIVFLCAARGNKDKGWEDLLASFKEAKLRKSTSSDIHLVFLGDGEYLNSLMQSLIIRDIQNFHFLGFQDNPRHWIEMADVTILLSYFTGESLPMVLIESLSVGRPIIATNVGSISDIIGTESSSKSGFLIPLDKRCQADIDVTIEAMLAYVDNKEILKLHSINAQRNFYQKFDINITGRSYMHEIFKLGQEFILPIS